MKGDAGVTKGCESKYDGEAIELGKVGEWEGGAEVNEWEGSAGN